MRYRIQILFATLAWFAVASGLIERLPANEDLTDATYLDDIQPLLAEKCIACHGALKQEAGLRLDHGNFIQQGVESGAIISASKNELHPILERVTTSDLEFRMPPEGQGAALTAAQVGILEQWIELGLPTPADEPLPLDPKQHWAWQPIQAPEICPPDVANPIDFLLERKLTEQSLEPLASADARTRLRRLTFDLIGLPPSPEALRDFESNPSDQAWNNQIESLLADSAYGERWARRWMDVWRYSDWDGYKNDLRGSQRHIWRWRDWIIQSLNEDRGYDRMVSEMLAGDEIAPEDPEVVRATGFLARNFHNSNRNIWLEATVEHTAKAFLALTLNCARCHDHKYDPISQKEYYAFRAIFEPHHVRTERVPGQRDVLKDGLARIYDAKPKEPTYLFQGGNEKLPDKEHPIAPNTPSIVAADYDVHQITLPPRAVFPALRNFIQQEEITKAQSKLSSAETALSKLTQTTAKEHDDPQLAEFTRNEAEAELKHAQAAFESLQRRWEADLYQFSNLIPKDQLKKDEHFLDLQHCAAQAEAEEARAEAELKLQTAKLKTRKLELAESTDAKAIEKAQAEQQELEEQFEKFQKESGSPATSYTSVGKSFPRTSTGRRLALADWITSPENPLTARVAANYVWMFHFGQPLVENTFDFGLRSPSPTHLDVLDYLATELLAHDWSLKHLHRLILTSQAYQRSSMQKANQHNQALDPDNQFFWRANARRLEAEVVRDTLLQVGGSLDRTIGGPELDFTQGEKIPRRSLYFRTAYEKQMSMLVLFDAAAPNECYRRSESIIPQQALALSNSALSFDQSRKLAGRIWQSEVKPNRIATNRVATNRVATNRVATNRIEDAKNINLAFEILLGRNCTAEELAHCQEFLAQQGKLLTQTSNLEPIPGGAKSQIAPASEPWQRARENLIHALMNHNDFVTIR